jgi:hypothetical protein
MQAYFLTNTNIFAVNLSTIYIYSILKQAIARKDPHCHTLVIDAGVKSCVRPPVQTVRLDNQSQLLLQGFP